MVPQTRPRLYPQSRNTNVNRCIQLSRTVSARIPTELHEELRERCNLIGESINDFIKAAIEFALHDSVDFDFGNELMEEGEKKYKIVKLGRNHP